MRTEWAPEQVSASAPHFAVIEGPRRSMVGEPCNAACECGWKGTTYAFGAEATRVAHARADADLHRRCMAA